MYVYDLKGLRENYVWQHVEGFYDKQERVELMQFDRITVDPAVMNGQPCIRHMRLTVRRILEALTIYPNWDNLIVEYPGLEKEDIRQALEWAAHNLDDEIVALDAA